MVTHAKQHVYQDVLSFPPDSGKFSFTWAISRIVPFATATLLLIAICDMILGVFFRYVTGGIAIYFDVANIDFFWVEEVGEFALAWMTMLGAAVGIVRGSHFRLKVLTHRLPDWQQTVVTRFNAALMVIFGLVAAYFGWFLAVLNNGSRTPGLQINMFWLYFAPVVGGILIAIYGAIVFIRPSAIDPDPIDTIEADRTV
jgi:TRAP-type C4-dicarboxylate transport system permease small subunit